MYSNSLVDAALMKNLLTIFKKYRYMDLCRAIFCINAWRGNRAELVVSTTLNHALEVCDKLGTLRIETYNEFAEFFDIVKSHYEHSVYVDEAVPDWGEVFITVDSEFYPVFMGNGYNYVFATMQCVPIVAENTKNIGIMVDVLTYVKTMIESLAKNNIYDAENSYGDLFMPTEDFFIDVCNYYQPIPLNSVPSGIVELLLRPTDIDKAHFLLYESFLFPLFSASIVVDAYTRLLSRLPIDSEISKSIIYSSLLRSFSLDGQTLMLKNVSAIEHIKDVEPIQTYCDGVFITQGNYGIFFVDERKFTPQELVVYRNKLLHSHRSGEVILKGLDLHSREISITIDSNCNFEIVSFDEIIGCCMSCAKGLSENELFRFMTLELVHCITSADSIEELFQYIEYTANKKIRHSFSFDGRCAEFEAWKLNNRQIIQGALDVGGICFELNLPEFLKWQKYRDTISRFYPKNYSKIFAYPENWRLVDEEHGCFFIINRAVHRLAGYIIKSETSYIYLDLFYEFDVDNLESAYKQIMHTISDLINKGLSDNKVALERYGFFSRVRGVHIFYLSPKSTERKVDFDNSKYFSGFCRIDNDGVANVACAFNLENIVSDLQCATDKTVECNIILDFLRVATVNSDFDYGKLSKEILTHSSEPRDFVLKAVKIDFYYNEDNYITFPKEVSFAAVVKRIAQICSNEDIQQGVYQGNEAKNVIRTMQGSLVRGFEDEIKKYNRTDLHRRMLSRLAAFIFSKTTNALTYGLSHEDITDDMKSTTKTISSDARENSKERIKTLHYAIETNLSLERDVALVAADEELNYIIAYADWLVTLQENSDNSRWGITTNKIEIEHDYKVMTIGDDVIREKQKKQQKRHYANQDYIPVGTPNEQERNAIIVALGEDIGISFYDVLLVMQHLEMEFIYTFQNCEVEKDVFAIYRDDIISDIAEAMIEKPANVEALISRALDFLTIDGRKIKSTSKEDGTEKQHEYLPIWERENRWHRVEIKPLTVINQEILFSPILVHEVKEMWLQGLMALYPPVEAHLNNMKSELAKISQHCQEQMEKDVADLFECVIGKTVVSFEFRKRQRTKTHVDVGDYDVLCVDIASKTIWNIECKFVHKVANIAEYANQQKGFFEQHKYQDKFQRRIDYLANHLQDLLDILKISGDSNEYTIISYMVTNKVFEAINRDLQFEIITFYELKQKLSQRD